MNAMREANCVALVHKRPSLTTGKLVYVRSRRSLATAYLSSSEELLNRACTCIQGSPSDTAESA